VAKAVLKLEALGKGDEYAVPAVQKTEAHGPVAEEAAR
jgi:hypothetical protein